MISSLYKIKIPGILTLIELKFGAYGILDKLPNVYNIYVKFLQENEKMVTK